MKNNRELVLNEIRLLLRISFLGVLPLVLGVPSDVSGEYHLFAESHLKNVNNGTEGMLPDLENTCTGPYNQVLGLGGMGECSPSDAYSVELPNTEYKQIYHFFTLYDTTNQGTAVSEELMGSPVIILE